MPDRLPIAREIPWAVRYGAAALLVAAATVLSPLLPQIAEHAPFMLFFVALAVAAFLGPGPAFLVIALSVLCVTYFFLAPGSLLPRQPADSVRLIAFGFSASLIAMLGHL